MLKGIRSILILIGITVVFVGLSRHKLSKWFKLFPVINLDTILFIFTIFFDDNIEVAYIWSVITTKATSRQSNIMSSVIYSSLSSRRFLIALNFFEGLVA